LPTLNEGGRFFNIVGVSVCPIVMGGPIASGPHTYTVHAKYMQQLYTDDIKGTVSRDFLPLVFFLKQLLLATVDKPSNDFDFFRIFAEIFDYFSASPVSTTPAMHALPVSLTPVNNSLPVSTTPVSDTFIVLESFTGVNDTGKKFLVGVIDTGKACIRRCQ
jgi:hypothetical protein